MTPLDLKSSSVVHGTTRTYYQVVVQGPLIDCQLTINSLFGSLVTNSEALIADLILVVIVLINQEVFSEHFLRNYC
jgi:hypothetical protein